MTHTEFKTLFLPLQQVLYKEAYRVLCDKSEAEDAVQNLFLRLWQQKERLATLQAPEGYCRAMLHNICIDRLRALKREKEVKDNLLSLNSEDEQLLFCEMDDEQEFIRFYLDGLPLPQRRVLQLRMSGFDYTEIEEITGLSAVNVRVIVSRLRKKFREYYKKG